MRAEWLRRRPSRFQMALLSLVIACFCAFWSLFSINLLPPGIESRQLDVAVAATEAIVDAPESWIRDARTDSSHLDTLTRHADLLGNLMSHDPVKRIIARRAGLEPDKLAATTRITGSFVAIIREPDYEERADQILAARRPYQLDIQASAVRPIIHVYAQAPTAAEAVRLADAAVAGLKEHLHDVPSAFELTPRRQVTVEQLGRPRAGQLNATAPIQIALFTFLVVLGLVYGLLVVAGRVREGWEAARSDDDARSAAGPALAPITRRRDDWPGTSRALPWMVAGFLCLVWLVPFNTIELSASLPFDLKLDRLVLPVLIGIWILSIAAGAGQAPRRRATPVHVAVGAFLAAASLSVVLNAESLTQALEFDLSTKKMLLLGSYVCFFLLVSIVVRRTEVPAFMKLVLGLALVCAIGTLWEYRFHYNVFYDLSGKVLPGLFTVQALDATNVDELGRRLTRGPAEHPLETTAMLSMALPIALVGLMRAKDPKRTILYTLAACVLVAAAMSTYRKSALVAPVAVIATLAYFRRADLGRLVPLAAISGVVVHFLAPGAVGAILVQLQPDRLSVGTVSDRALDYDALRADLWTHLPFGRGFGSYEHTFYRVLDSEILGLLVMVGIVGLLCYLAMILTIVCVARRPMRSRDPVEADIALAIAAAAMSFLVMSVLFDVMSFPHGPYILLSLAGLLAALVGDTGSVQASPSGVARHSGVDRHGGTRARETAPERAASTVALR